jgi:hypothetical protein
VLVYTLGFPDRATLLFKFDKHVTRGREFPYADADEYETHADSFNGGPRGRDTEQCHRTKRDGSVGDQIRYNTQSEAFGILGSDNVIRSYYVPDPGRHGMANNLVYFQDSCRQVRG